MKMKLCKPAPTVNRAVIYCRVSSQEQVQNYSLGTQEKACRDFCHQRGYEVEAVFLEKGESAKTIDRPEFCRMMDYCNGNKSKVGWVIVYDLSRLARNSHDYQSTRLYLSKLGILLQSVTQPFDQSPYGAFQENMLSAMAQLDNEIRAHRTVVGMEAAIQAGRWTFKAPIGYLNSRLGKSGPSLIPDPDRAPLIRQAFEMFSTGLHTKEQVLARVTAMGLASAKGKSLSPQAFYGLFKRPVYAGWIQISGDDTRHRGDFTPIVDQTVFDRVQGVLAGRSVTATPHNRNHPEFPLRLFVRCGCCGKPLTGSKSKGRSKRYAYYHCRTKACKNSARKEAMESAFVALLEQVMPKPEYARLFREIVLDVWHEKQAAHAKVLSALEKRVTGLKERKQRLLEAFIYEKVIDRETHDEQAGKLNQEILFAELEANDAKLEGFDLEAVVNFAEQILTNAPRLWLNASLEQRQRFQKAIFPNGLTFANGEFGTAVTSPIFSLLQPNPEGDSKMATLRGIEPRLLP